MSNTRILVCSDTHGHVKAISDAILELQDIDRIFHLGDYTADVPQIEAYTGRSILSIRGNNDYYDWRAPLEVILEIESFRLLLVHGHEQHVYRGPKFLAHYAKEKGCDIALYGHSHAFDVDTVEGVLCINPGALSWPRGDGNKSYVILTLEEGKEPLVERFLVE